MSWWSSRRRFIAYAGAFGAGSFLSFFHWRRAPFVELVHQETSFLRLGRGTERAFARDYELAYRLEHGDDAWTEQRAKLLRGEVRFPLAQLLLSTDFFLNGADESKVVRYVRYYDPIRGCRNPFAELELEEKA